jgi:hypothetical protein
VESSASLNPGNPIAQGFRASPSVQCTIDFGWGRAFIMWTWSRKMATSRHFHTWWRKGKQKTLIVLSNSCRCYWPDWLIDRIDLIQDPCGLLLLQLPAFSGLNFMFDMDAGMRNSNPHGSWRREVRSSSSSSSFLNLGQLTA